jgi:hypothetical protein
LRHRRAREKPLAATKELTMGSVPRYLRGVQLDVDETFSFVDEPYPDECPEMPESAYFEPFEPSEEDRRWWAEVSNRDEDADRVLEAMAAVSASLDRLERGLCGDGCDHSGSFAGHDA